MRNLLSFGSYTFLTQLVNYASSNVDTLIVGRIFGTGVVAQYNRAYQISFAPTQQIASPLTRVFLPVLAGESTTEGFAARIRQIRALLTFSVGGVLSAVAGTAPWLVPLVLGANWRAAVPLLQVLALAGVLQAMGYAYYWALLATARTRSLLLTELGARVAMIGLILILAPHGALPVALAVAVGQALLLASTASVVGTWRSSGVWSELGDYLIPLSAFALASFAAAAVPQLIPGQRSDIVGTALALAVWAVVVLLLMAIPPFQVRVRRVARDFFAVARRPR